MCARNALSAVRRRQGAREMHSQAPGGGDMLTLCVPRCLTMAIFCPGVSRKWPRSGKGSLRGNISPPCIQNELALARYARHVSEKPPQIAVGGYIARRSCQEGALFAAQTPRIMHGAKILPRSTFARPCARKSRGAGYRKRTSYCGRRPHHRGCVRLRQPCSITVAAALWPVAQTHDSQCCGERAVSGAYARPAPRHPPACSVCLANGIRPPAATFAAGASRRPRAQ